MPHGLSRAPRRAISTPTPTPLTSTQWMRREAKRLHRAAASDSPSAGLPVLRRLLAAQVFSAHTLPALFRMLASVQRRHVLRLLAIEAVQFAAAHGGRPERVGKEAVVLPEDTGGDAGVSSF